MVFDTIVKNTKEKLPFYKTRNFTFVSSSSIVTLVNQNDKGKEPFDEVIDKIREGSPEKPFDNEIVFSIEDLLASAAKNVSGYIVNNPE